jgi:type IV secretory pathway TraG/TraD family ATPase VirD4
LQSLQNLPKLAMVLREARKSGVSAAIGFHVKSDLKGIYGEEAETIISAPATKILLRIGDPEAQEWASKICGDHEVERLREHVDHKGHKSYSTERTTERLVMATEFADFEPRVGILRHGPFAVKIKVRYPDSRPDKAEGFIQSPGKPSAILPLPTLEEIQKQQEEEQKRKAQELARIATAGSAPSGERKRGRNVHTPQVRTTGGES